jgi:hypothetical protein
MNEKTIICHDCDGFKWQNINIYSILIVFLCDQCLSWLVGLWLHPPIFIFKLLIENNCNWQVDNFIIHYKCPRKGYPIEINKLNPKACRHILHLSNRSADTHIMKWTHLLYNTLNECKPQWGRKKYAHAQTLKLVTKNVLS